jgi:2-alkenal reductase
MKTFKKILVGISILTIIFLTGCSALSQSEEILTTKSVLAAPQGSNSIPVQIDSDEPSDTVIELQNTLIDIYQGANPSVVFIITDQGSGSGFVFDLDGHIVTNNHVVTSSRSYEIVFSNGERRQASLVGTDADSDLAVIKVDDLPNGVKDLPLAEFNSIQVGQIVVAIGNPFGNQGSMSMGIVSGVGRSLPSTRNNPLLGGYSLPEVIQTDAPINPGNSGGPLLNLDGEVIGVNSAITSGSGTSSGVGFAIPLKALQKIVPILIKDGKFVYSYMGVSFDNEISLDEQSIYGVPQTQGAYVISITVDSPAGRSDLIAANQNTGEGGDLIIAIDGRPVNTFVDLNSYLVFNTSPGQQIELTLIRQGKQISVPLTLSARP